MDPDLDPDPALYPTSFFSNFKDAKKYFFSYFLFYSYNLPIGILFSVLKLNFMLMFCVKILFCKHYFSPLNKFIRKEKDPYLDPYL
jgi:hypothetical protein